MLPALHRFFLILLLTSAISAGGLQEAKAQQPATPQIPARRFIITEFGAVADGKKLNTTAIQQALDKAAAGGGGKVIVPAGEFLCGPLLMKGKTELVLERAAVLRLQANIDAFPNNNGRYLNFIQIKNGADIKISGSGTIDGQGRAWWEAYTAGKLSIRRPQMVYIEDCKRVEISGITFLNPPNTHLSLKDCSGVYIHGIRIEAPAESRNTDGINISARNCLIEDCDISTGDDNIAVSFGGKALAEPQCAHITIRKCRFGAGHGLSVGSYTSGGLRDMSVSDCSFDGTTSAIRIKTARGRGGLVENLSYTNIKITNCKWPVFISEYYPKEPATPQSDTAQAVTITTPHYRNIALKNVYATGCGEAIRIWGIPESPIEGLRFTNVHIEAGKGAQIYNAKAVSFEQSSVSAAQGDRVKTFNAEVTGL